MDDVMGTGVVVGCHGLNGLVNRRVLVAVKNAIGGAGGPRGPGAGRLVTSMVSGHGFDGATDVCPRAMYAVSTQHGGPCYP